MESRHLLARGVIEFAPWHAGNQVPEDASVVLSFIRCRTNPARAIAPLRPASGVFKCRALNGRVAPSAPRLDQPLLAKRSEKLVRLHLRRRSRA